MLTGQRKYLSFHVAGQRSTALRLVSNNCQLNYKNYKALMSPDLDWITFSPPENCDQLRTYAELMTMFDNPKFPDQLSALGGIRRITSCRGKRPPKILVRISALRGP